MHTAEEPVWLTQLCCQKGLTTSPSHCRQVELFPKVHPSGSWGVSWSALESFKLRYFYWMCISIFWLHLLGQVRMPFGDSQNSNT